MSLQTFGKYQLVQKLATGGMAEVFLARAEGPMGFEKTLVVKRVLPHHAENPLFIAMFLAEAKLAARLDHPNVVQIFDFGEQAGAYYLAMEYIDGPNLRTLIHRAWKQGEPPKFVLCAKVVALACEGLAYAHNFRDPNSGEPLGLVHRDISPDNIMVSRSGAVKVVDFGIAKVSNGVNLTKSGVIKGKMAYMPPEQLARGTIDQRVDVFALGMVLYELLTGTMPFDCTSEVSIIQAIMGPDPILPVAQRRSDVPLALQRIVGRALAKRREARYPDCRAYQEDLERYLTSSGETVSGHTLAEWVRYVEMPIEVRGATEPSAEEVAAHLAATGSGVADTLLRPTPAGPPTENPFVTYRHELRPELPSVEPAATTSNETSTPQRRSRRPWLGLLGALVLLGGFGAMAALHWRPRPVLPDPVIAETPPPHPTAIPVASPAPAVEPVSAPPVPTPPSVPAVAPPQTPRSSLVQVEFRVRPYAFVYLDGRAIGQTPFAPVHISEGAHRVKLVNAVMGKEITVQVNVPARREWVFRYNLGD